MRRNMLLLSVICLAPYFCLASSLADECVSCEKVKSEPICASDGITYTSYCQLQREQCLNKKQAYFVCDGTCPCDPAEIEKYDKETFKFLQNSRTKIQLAKHEAESLNSSPNFLTLEVLKDDPPVPESCTPAEMSEMPIRLIDWFHVLKLAEKEKEIYDSRIEHEAVMKEQNFATEKLKAMYATLACIEQKDEEIEKAVCVEPVKWMFNHLDTNNDNSLSHTETAEMVNIKKEHCIKPFLKRCDYNNDGKVMLSEFCRCLCITPPCTRIIKDIPSIVIRGEPKPFPGYFTPKCDEDGFFMPKQCNPKNECWCVDRNGAELEGTRKTNGEPRCDSVNTKIPPKGVKLIPLDVEKESKKSK